MKFKFQLISWCLLCASIFSCQPHNTSTSKVTNDPKEKSRSHKASREELLKKLQENFDFESFRDRDELFISQQEILKRHIEKEILRESGLISSSHKKEKENYRNLRKTEIEILGTLYSADYDLIESQLHRITPKDLHPLVQMRLAELIPDVDIELSDLISLVFFQIEFRDPKGIVTPETYRRLETYLKEGPNSPVYQCAADILAHLNPQNPVVREQIILYDLTSSDEYVRLSRIDELEPKDLSLSIKVKVKNLLEDPNVHVRNKALSLLVEASEFIEPQKLMNLMTNKVTRPAALRSIGRTYFSGAPESIEVMLAKTYLKSEFKDKFQEIIRDAYWRIYQDRLENSIRKYRN